MTPHQPSAPDQPPLLPLLVVTTVGSAEEAQALARALVEARLAACAQVEPIESVYRWNGAVQCEREFRITFKTTAARYAEAQAAILARHPYELPAIHAVQAAAVHAPYARWVDQETTRDGSA